MKAIMYISQAVNKGTAPWMPYDYAALTKVSRENNLENKITGVLSYQDGYFLQYIEGPTSEIERLIVKIARDKRHDDIQLLMNHDIARRNFSNWSMPMGSKLRKDQNFARFATQYQFGFANLSPEVRDILNKFYMFEAGSVRSAIPPISSGEKVGDANILQNNNSTVRLFDHQPNRLAALASRHAQ